MMTKPKLNEQIVRQIEHDFSISPAINKKIGLLQIVNNLNYEEQIYLKFIYAYMPASDIASYSIDLFLKHVKAMTKIRRESPFGDKVSDELFFNYVLPLRINNENLEDYREEFFSEIRPRIRNIPMEQAVLEVNYWAFEKATYKSTDIRTLSPVSIIRNAYGRCGEESVLCVAALRSVGIPARQCYTPRWAHCDDNHAWVEVWVDGKWHCIGACEPEPVLDKGWFVETAIRGMLIHARLFTGFVFNEIASLETPIFKHINILDHYTETKTIDVYVKDIQNKPVENAEVRFELINFSQFYPLIVLKTDKDGKVSFQTGFGDLYVHVVWDKKFDHKKAHRNCNELVFCIDEFKTEDTKDFEYTQIPPVAKSVEYDNLTETVEKKHEEKVAKALEIRRNFESRFLSLEKARDYASGFPQYQDKIATFISLSNGNYLEIQRFLEKDMDLLSYKVLLLASLKPKDLSDIKCEILEGHLDKALAFKDAFSEGIFVNYILCPRICYEMISDYRGFITDYFDENEKDAFRKSPIRIYDYINRTIEDCLDQDYDTISATPQGLLELKYGSKMSRKILFAAICRTLGIPARMNEVDFKMEFMQGENWCVIGEEGDRMFNRSCTLEVVSSDINTSIQYEKQFTLARLEDGIYRTLNLNNVAFVNGKVHYVLEEGNYRVVVSNRLVDGTILADVIHIKLHNGDEKSITIRLREPNVVEKESVKIPDIHVKKINGAHFITNNFAKEDGKSIVAFLGVGKEPTEHLLNEINEQWEKFAEHKDKVLLILKDVNCLDDKLLKSTLDLVGFAYCFDAMTEDDFKILLDALHIKNMKLPLVLGIDEEKKCAFHVSSYNVGTGDLLLGFLK